MIVQVVVEPLTCDLSEEDNKLNYRYNIELPDNINKQVIPNIALDVFHETIAIDVLEDFDIYVVDDKDNIIPINYETEPYALSHLGKFIS